MMIESEREFSRKIGKNEGVLGTQREDRGRIEGGNWEFSKNFIPYLGEHLII